MPFLLFPVFTLYAIGKKLKYVGACLNKQKRFTTRGPWCSSKSKTKQPNTLSIQQTQNSWLAGACSALPVFHSICDPAVFSRFSLLPAYLSNFATSVLRLPSSLTRMCPLLSRAWVQTAKSSMSILGATSSCQHVPRTTMKHWMKNSSTN